MKKVYILFFQIILFNNISLVYSLSLKNIIEESKNYDSYLRCEQPEQPETLIFSCKITHSKDKDDELILNFSASFGSDYLHDYKVYLKYTYDGKDYKLRIRQQTNNSYKSDYFDIVRPVLTEKEKNLVRIYLLVNPQHVLHNKENYKLIIIIYSDYNDDKKILYDDTEQTFVPLRDIHEKEIIPSVELFKTYVKSEIIRVPLVRNTEALVYIYSKLMDHVFLCEFDGCKQNMFSILDNILLHRDMYPELPLILRIGIDMNEKDKDNNHYYLNSINNYRWFHHYIMIYRTKNNNVYVIDPLYRTNKLVQLDHIPLLSDYLDEIDPEHKSLIKIFTYNDTISTLE